MSHPPPKRILVIEDDEHIAEGLKLNLSLQGYDVATAASGTAGLTLWKEWRPDLIVLDIMLPGIDGLSVLRNIRFDDDRLPILILSAKDATDDKVKGLAYGVDDYLTKPFNLEEFLLRVDRLLKRVSWYERDGESVANDGAEDLRWFAFGGNRIDLTTQTAHCRHGEIRLTDQEVKLLKIFIAHRGRPLSRRRLLELGWGYAGGTATRTVDNFIVRFRKYFERNPKRPVHFKSVRAVGYVFDPS